MKTHLTVKTTLCIWKQMDGRADRDDCITSPANVVGNHARWQLII